MEKVSITRKELLAKYNVLTAKIANIESSNTEETSLIYRTENKYIPGVGVISEIEDKKLLIKAHKFIKEQFVSDDAIAVELGIELETEQETYLGFSAKLWLKEIKQRVQELQENDNLTKYKSALEIVKKNLSADDLFELEMSTISDVLSDIDNIELED